MLPAPRSASHAAKRRPQLVVSVDFLQGQKAFCAETALRALPKLICRVLRHRGVVLRRRGPSAKHAAMRARFRLHGWWQEMMTQTAMMRTVRVPLTAISRDSADHPCGNCAAVGRIITIAHTVLLSTVFPEQFLGRRRRMTGQICV
jgi:hypothetical protein